jgi:hypothetical protein
LNPGDLEFEPWQEKYGAALESGPYPRFAVFPTVAQGFAAQSALLIKDYAGLTVREFGYKYAPPPENDTDHYIAEICTFTQFTPETVLVPLLLQPPEEASEH